MHVQRVDDKVRVELYHLVNVDERQYEGLLRAASVLQDSASGRGGVRTGVRERSFLRRQITLR